MQTTNTSKWSNEELTMLVNLYPNRGSRIPELKRSHRAIQTKANRLGLRSGNGRAIIISEEMVNKYYKLWPEDKIARNGNGKEIYTVSGKLLVKHLSILRHIVEDDVRNAVRLNMSVDDIQNICTGEGFEPKNAFDWELRISKRSSDRMFLIRNNEVMSIIKTSEIEKVANQQNSQINSSSLLVCSLFDKTLTLSEILSGIRVKTDKDLKAMVSIGNHHIKMRVGDKIRIRLFI